MSQKPWIERKGWAKVAGLPDKDRVSVVYDEDLGAIAANWVDGSIVSTGADRSPLYPVKMPDDISLALYIAYSHLCPETRMPAIEWLAEHDQLVDAKLMTELADWYKGIGEIP